MDQELRAYLQEQFAGMEARMDERFAGMEQRFTGMEQRFAGTVITSRLGPDAVSPRPT